MKKGDRIVLKNNINKAGTIVGGFTRHKLHSSMQYFNILFDNDDKITNSIGCWEVIEEEFIKSIKK